jgi:hypothetical protein
MGFTQTFGIPVVGDGVGVGDGDGDGGIALGNFDEGLKEADDNFFGAHV